MRLFDLVEQHHRIRTAADLFGQLSRLVVPDVSGRRSDDPGNAVLLHKLRHIQADKRFGRMEQVGGKRFYKFGLSHAGRSGKDKGNRFSLVGNARTVALDRPCDRLHRLVLTDNAPLQAGLQLVDLLKLVFADIGCGNSRPDLNDRGNVRLAERYPLAVRLQILEALGRLQFLCLDLGDLLVAFLGALFVRRGIVLQLFPAFPQGKQLLPKLLGFVERRTRKRKFGRCFVQKVNRLVRQIAVGNIALGKHDGALYHLVRNPDGVEFLVIMLDALQHLHGLRNGRLVDRHGLETALQSGILFDIFPVFVERGGADDAHLSTGKGGLQDIGGVDASLRIAGTDDVVNLVNDKNHVPRFPDLGKQAENPGFKLSPELGPRHKGGQVHKINLFSLELVRNVAVGNFLGKRFGNRRFTHAGLADQAGIVLLTTAKDLNDTLQFPVPSDDPVQLAVCGTLGKVAAVGVEIFVLLALFRLFPLGVATLGAVLLLLGSGKADVLEQLRNVDGRGAAVLRIVIGHGQIVPHFPDVIVDVLFHIFQLFGRNAKLVHHVPQHIVHRYAKLLGALDAKPLVDFIAVFQLGYENDSHKLVAP